MRSKTVHLVSALFTPLFLPLTQHFSASPSLSSFWRLGVLSRSRPDYACKQTRYALGVCLCVAHLNFSAGSARLELAQPPSLVWPSRAERSRAQAGQAAATRLTREQEQDQELHCSSRRCFLRRRAASRRQLRLRSAHRREPAGSGRCVALWCAQFAFSFSLAAGTVRYWRRRNKVRSGGGAASAWLRSLGFGGRRPRAEFGRSGSARHDITGRSYLSLRSAPTRLAP